ncbi:MAG: hypothetical protein VKN72_18480 [Nostocales cyanobacterium 94392]|nr:hypothetical protein [Nostocales cyanobacterium 94392]
MKSKFITLIGTALTLALSSTVAVAQSNKFPNQDLPSGETTTETSEPSADGSNMVAASEEKLSPQAMEILCVRFPLNSRCEGKAEATTSPENTNTEEITPPDNTIETTPDAPLPGTTPEGEVAPSEDDAPTNITPIPGGVTPEATPSEDDAPTNLNQPGGTTLPDSNSPNNTEEETTPDNGAGILAPQ